MFLPAPPVTLDGQCTVIYDNTLYAFQSNAFQSLPLTEGAKWTKLPMGVPVSGAQCVLAVSEGQDALFIVGGTTNLSSLSTYPGFQRYTFANQQWTRESPQVSVIQNRQMHGAAYLNSSSSILVYGGFQDDSYQYSSQTFTINTAEPYLMQAYPSAAPPVKNPILLSLNETHGLLVGGAPGNQEVWTFSEADGWNQMNNITLPIAPQNPTYVRGSIYRGDDGGKYLQLFNMSASPNTVVTVALVSGSGTSLSNRGVQALSSGLSARKKSRPSEKRRRDVSSSGYPAYNGTLAPTVTREGFSIAQDSSGLVVISGGVNPTSDEALCMFNQTANAWVNTNQFFIASTPTVTASPLASSPSSSSSAAAAAAMSTSGRSQSLIIVGAVLGAVFGFASFCVLLLLILRCFRQRRLHDRRRRHASDAKGEMDFTDRGAEFMVSAGGSFSSSTHNAHFYPQTTTVASGPAQQPKRGLFHKAGDSTGSANSFFARNKSPVILAPQLDPVFAVTSPERPITATQSPEPRTGPRTDEGWSTYFTENNNPTDLSRLPPGHTRYEIPNRDTAYTTTTQSDYTADSRVVSSQPHASAEVPPLNLRNTISHIPEEDDFLEESSSGQDSWTPIATSDKGSSWGDRPAGERPPSSIYGDTGVYPHPGNRVRIPNFPGVPTSNRTSQNTILAAKDERGLRTLASKDFAGGLTAPIQRRLPEEGVRADISSEGQRVRPSPRPAGDAYGIHRDFRPEGEDENLSWLNLNAK